MVLTHTVGGCNRRVASLVQRGKAAEVLGLEKEILLVRALPSRVAQCDAIGIGCSTRSKDSAGWLSAMLLGMITPPGAGWGSCLRKPFQPQHATPPPAFVQVLSTSGYTVTGAPLEAMIKLVSEHDRRKALRLGYKVPPPPPPPPTPHLRGSTLSSHRASPLRGDPPPASIPPRPSKCLGSSLPLTLGTHVRPGGSARCYWE